MKETDAEVLFRLLNIDHVNSAFDVLHSLLKECNHRIRMANQIRRDCNSNDKITGRCNVLVGAFSGDISSFRHSQLSELRGMRGNLSDVMLPHSS